jgi:peptide/nickel transport system ATP-binding protein
MTILDVKNLQTHFHTPRGVVRAVNGVSFQVAEDETVAIVGESGSGKSVMALSILRLLASPPARTTGAVLFQGVDLLSLPPKETRRIRGNRISMVFQEPMTSLNPVLTLGRQIAEPLRLHRGLSRREARDRSIELLRTVGIPSPEGRLDNYPHQFSGGMRQRVMIAMALACSPKLLIADEPTTALDVTIQAQVLDLMRGLRREFGSSIMLITHDLGVVAEMADRVIVMYAGRAVEQASVKQLFAKPKHPYTKGLLNSLPKLGSVVSGGRRTKLSEIGGTVPSLREEIVGCAFAPRCSRASTTCRAVTPEMEEKSVSHYAACHHPIGVEAMALTS